MSDNNAELESELQRPRRFYTVVEKKTWEGGTQVDASRLFTDREDAEEERKEIAAVLRIMDVEEPDAWDKWSVRVCELLCFDDVDDAEQMGDKEYEMLTEAADATAESMLEVD